MTGAPTTRLPKATFGQLLAVAYTVYLYRRFWGEVSLEGAGY